MARGGSALHEGDEDGFEAGFEFVDDLAGVDFGDLVGGGGLAVGEAVQGDALEYFDVAEAAAVIFPEVEEGLVHEGAAEELFGGVFCGFVGLVVGVGVLGECGGGFVGGEVGEGGEAAHVPNFDLDQAFEPGAEAGELVAVAVLDQGKILESAGLGVAVEAVGFADHGHHDELEDIVGEVPVEPVADGEGEDVVAVHFEEIMPGAFAASGLEAHEEGDTGVERGGILVGVGLWHGCQETGCR